ncbi:MAG: hypothetical protein ABR909_03795 [Candidatus Bathyarchaeia archaeon]
MHMVDITISIPQELYDKMKRHSEVKWSEVVRKAIASYVYRLEIVEGGVVPMKRLTKKLKDSGVDTSSIDLEKAIKYYEEGRKLEWKRLSSTQTN